MRKIVVFVKVALEIVKKLYIEFHPDSVSSLLWNFGLRTKIMESFGASQIKLSQVLVSFRGQLGISSVGSVLSCNILGQSYKKYFKKIGLIALEQSRNIADILMWNVTWNVKFAGCLLYFLSISILTIKFHTILVILPPPFWPSAYIISRAWAPVLHAGWTQTCPSIKKLPTNIAIVPEHGKVERKGTFRLIFWQSIEITMAFSVHFSGPFHVNVPPEFPPE